VHLLIRDLAQQTTNTPAAMPGFFCLGATPLQPTDSEPHSLLPGRPLGYGRGASARWLSGLLIYQKADGALSRPGRGAPHHIKSLTLGRTTADASRISALRWPQKLLQQPPPNLFLGEQHHDLIPLPDELEQHRATESQKYHRLAAECRQLPCILLDQRNDDLRKAAA
jgi:hypothetical protein